MPTAPRLESWRDSAMRRPKASTPEAAAERSEQVVDARDGDAQVRVLQHVAGELGVGEHALGIETHAAGHVEVVRQAGRANENIHRDKL